MLVLVEARGCLGQGSGQAAASQPHLHQEGHVHGKFNLKVIFLSKISVVLKIEFLPSHMIVQKWLKIFSPSNAKIIDIRVMAIGVGKLLLSAFKMNNFRG